MDGDTDQAAVDGRVDSCQALAAEILQWCSVASSTISLAEAEEKATLILSRLDDALDVVDQHKDERSLQMLREVKQIANTVPWHGWRRWGHCAIMALLVEARNALAGEKFPTICPSESVLEACEALKLYWVKVPSILAAMRKERQQ